MKSSVSREDIEATEVFQSLDKVKQQFVAKKDNINWLKQNYVIATNVGHEQWLKQCGTATQINKEIIHELLNK